VVSLFYGLLFLAVLIAAFGIANTLSLSVYERTRELGLVRAVGATRRQVRSTVRWESVITALLGAIQGIIIGILLGYAVTLALSDEGLNSFTLPIPTLIIILVVAFVIGVVAAIRPARRAARLDVLRAVTVE
jgi:putative ABC transport system permease protein